LLKEKTEPRSVELAAGERHFGRLQEGRPESIETSSVHLDVLRDLRRIHSHLCSVAYPVLEASGELYALRAGQSQIATTLPHSSENSSSFDRF
jgi:phosphate:Na+ symporter